MERFFKCFFIICLLSKAAGWSCISTSKVFSRVNTDAVLHFNLSRYIDQNAQGSFYIRFSDNTNQGLVIYNSGSISTEVIPGVKITVDVAGKVVMTKRINESKNAGIYYISSTTLPTFCTCLYILGTPTKPSISVTNNPSVGGNTTLTCTSTSNTTPSNHSLSFMYNWQVDSTDNSTDPRYSYSTNRNTLTLSNIMKVDASKQFTCTATEDVSGGYTSSRSDSKSLDVRYPPDGPPVITGYNDGGEYYVIEGTQGQLSCSVSGGNPAPTLTWNCINSGTSQTINSGTVTKLHIWMAKRNQDRTCTCKASHYSGNKDVSIKIATLYPPTRPMFKINSTPVDQTVKVIRDHSLSVTCSSEGKPEPSYIWTYPNRTSSIGSQLNVSSVQTNGNYTCDAQNTMDPSVGDNVTRSNSSFIDVHILYPPSPPTFSYWNTSGDSISTRYLDVIKDDTFHVACLSTGEPTPTFQWNNQGTSQILTVNYITSNQSRTCTVRNTMVETVGQSLNKSATATLEINVFYPPSAVAVKYHYGESSMHLSTNLSIIEGNPFRVICSSDSRPYPSYKWTGQVSSSSHTVEVTSTNKGMAGEYVCEVKNVMTRTYANPEKEVTGEAHGSFRLDILYPPIIKELKNVSITEGLQAVISCPVTFGNPPETTFKWKRNGTVWKTTQNVTIETVSRADAMLYTCIASNTMQQTGENPVSQEDSKSLYLNVWYTTTVTDFFVLGHQGETNVTMNENDPVEFQCNADSNPGSTLSLIYKETVTYTKTNIKSATFRIVSAGCTESGKYTCEGFNKYNVRNSTKHLILNINCLPRPSPFVKLEENVTSALHKPAVLMFTALAYPPPGPDDFKWYRLVNNTQSPLLHNEQFWISTSNLQSNLTIVNINNTYFGMYKLEVKNSIGTYEQYFYISPEDVPEPPHSFRHVAELVSESTVTVKWTPGLDNGPAQTFVLRYKKTSDHNWRDIEIQDTGALTMNYTISGLSSGTSYYFTLYSYNKLGNSSEAEQLTITTKDEDEPTSPAGLIAGGVGGGLACAVLVVIGIILVRRYRTSKGKSEGRVELNGRRKEDEDSSDDEVITENAMYESASAVSEKKHVGDVYAKPMKKPSNDIYAVVNKSKNTGQKKLKEGKKKKTPKGDIYENAPGPNVGKKTYTNTAYDESPYEIQEAGMQPKRNADGLIYADLIFNDQPKGQKKLVIHGLDDMTEYAEVDITKRADPLPESDNEDQDSAAKKQ